MNEEQKPDNVEQDIPIQQLMGGGKETGPGEAKMEAAYELASSLVRDRLKQEDRENIDILEKMDETDVIVVEGQYDHIHLVLKHSGIPFMQVHPGQVHELNLRPDQTVFVNCAGSFPEEMNRKLAAFVDSGGQLITTDWCLRSVIEQAFPNTVRYNNRASADEVVRIEILDREDPILKGFLDEEADPVWWLEGSSYPIEILDKEKVKILIRSKELGEKYGEDPVIVNFDHGEGTVYHMISHFYLQRTETRDAKQKGK
ncbi:MAG: hypothetical protein ACXAD7_23370, partial [Candidatus Kariarchaeaceae archaeon]